jgi:hypothetical protein
MKIAAVVIVALLVWIGVNIQQHESREADARHDRARAASAYLNCEAAGNTGCLPPESK